MTLKQLSIFLILGFSLTSSSFTPVEVPEYEVNLSKAPIDRYNEFPEELCTRLAATKILVATAMVLKHGEQNYLKFLDAIDVYIVKNTNTEFIQEMMSIKNRCNLDLRFLVSANFLQEMLTVGCTSIIFKAKNGLIRSAQNLDYVLGDQSVPLAFKAVFTKDNKIIAKTAKFFGFYGVFRGLRFLDGVIS